MNSIRITVLVVSVLGAVLVALTLLPAPLHADEVVLAPTRDATLYEEVNGLLANGAGSYLFTGYGNAAKRTVLHFDVAGAVPSGSVIDSVELQLYMSRTIVLDEPVTVHRVTSAWTEGASDAPAQEGTGIASEPGDATWIHTSYDAAFWLSPGGDFDAAVQATADVDAEGFYLWSSAAMTTQAQSWLDAPAGNHGWLLLGREIIGTPSAKRFDSRENPNVAQRPALRIVFTPPPTIPTAEPAALALLALLLAAGGVWLVRRG